MKKWLEMILLCVLGSAPLSACDNALMKLEKRFYVQASQFCFADARIYVNVEDFVYETPAIFSDEKGYYIEAVVNTGCAWYEWKCINPNCGLCNLKGVDLSCRGCGRPRSQ